MRVEISDNFLYNTCDYLSEIEIDGKLVTLYQYSERKYYLCIEDDGVYQFNSRKAVNAYLPSIK